MKKTLLGTGLSGLVGSRMLEMMSSEYEFENLSLETGVNILNIKEVDQRFSSSKAEWVLHFAAKTNVDGCEKDKKFGEKGDAWKINVMGTKNIALACKKFNKKMLYISTDFVFDGKEKRYYEEEDPPNPLSWYAVTKYEGEKIVQKSHIPYLICRPAYPYRAVNSLKKDLVHVILDRLKNNEKITAVTDQFITPTLIDDIALAIKILITKDQTGIFHINGSQAVTPFDLALKIAQVFNFDKNLIDKITLKAYYQNRAARPFHAVLKNDKIQALGVTMNTLDTGLKIIKKQMGEIL